MPYDFLNNNPLLADMSPEKLQFLMNFATAKKPTDIKEMMPFLLSAMNSAKSNNIQFSEPETDLLFQILKQNMSAEESAKYHCIETDYQKHRHKRRHGNLFPCTDLRENVFYPCKCRSINRWDKQKIKKLDQRPQPGMQFFPVFCCKIMYIHDCLPSLLLLQVPVLPPL